jgi:hypothetical protein
LLLFFTKARSELARRFAVTSRDDHPSMPLQAGLMAPARATIHVAEVRLLKAFQIRDVTELVAHDSERRRARAGTITATDAIVIAFRRNLQRTRDLDQRFEGSRCAGRTCDAIDSNPADVGSSHLVAQPKRQPRLPLIHVRHLIWVA